MEIFCDLCGKDLQKQNTEHKAITVTTILGEHEIKTTKHYDLCSGCYDKIINKSKQINVSSFPKIVIEKERYQDISWETYILQYFVCHNTRNQFFEERFKTMEEAIKRKKEVEEEWYGNNI